MSKSAQRNERLRADEMTLLEIIEADGPTNRKALAEITGIPTKDLRRALRRLIASDELNIIGMQGAWAMYDSPNRAQPEKGYQPSPGVRVVSCNDHPHPKPFTGLNATKITGWGQSSLA